MGNRICLNALAFCLLSDQVSFPPRSVLLAYEIWICGLNRFEAVDTEKLRGSSVCPLFERARMNGLLPGASPKSYSFTSVFQGCYCCFWISRVGST